MYKQLFSLALLAQAIQAAPVPVLITRYHTAPTVTTTQTFTTATTTIYLPPVELLISNGVSFTFTKSDEQWATTPVTKTNIVNDNQATQAPPPPPPVAPPAPTTDAAPPASPSSTNAPVNTNVPVEPTPGTSIVVPTSSSLQPPTNQVSQPQQEATSTPSTSSTLPSTTKSTSPPSNPIVSSSTSDTQTPTGSGFISPPSSIVYSPYQDNGNCKDQSTINSDLEYISGKGIKKIRIYGTDCNLFTATLPKSSQLGITVNQGLWFTLDGASSIDGGVADIINYGSTNGWSVFDFITVGNEAINDNVLTVLQLTSKISSVKQQLRSKGYNGAVTTSEPPVSFTRHPELCTSSDIDIVGINPHSYFDAGVDASQAGSFVADQKKLVEAACGSKQVLITETGYPSQGNTNGLNVPSPANQRVAILSIIDNTGGDVTILTTYNDFWKLPGPNGIEQYFGVGSLFA